MCAYASPNMPPPTASSPEDAFAPWCRRPRAPPMPPSCPVGRMVMPFGPVCLLAPLEPVSAMWMFFGLLTVVPLAPDEPHVVNVMPPFAFTFAFTCESRVLMLDQLRDGGPATSGIELRALGSSSTSQERASCAVPRPEFDAM